MRMSLAQRVLLTWLFTLLFLIMLVLKLDEKAPWNWFLIFIPVWIFDTILLVMLIVKMAGRCKSGFDPRNGSQNIKKKAWWISKGTAAVPAQSRQHVALPYKDYPQFSYSCCHQEIARQT